MKKIKLFLMTQKGYQVLKSFVKEIGAQYIQCVVGARDPNVKNDYFQEISDFCNSRNIQLLDKNQEHSISSDFSFAISWRWFISNDNTNLIVLHDSILPKYRGFAPLVNSLINGEKKIGVTTLFANKDYDRGDIISQQIIEIQYPIKINDAIKKLSKCYCNLVNDISRKIINGDNITSLKQKESEATYSLWLDEHDYDIDWKGDACFIKRFIDSVGYPYKGASTYVNKRKVRIFEAEGIKEKVIENRKPGKVLFVEDKYPIVVCGKGLLKLTKVIDNKTEKSILPLQRFRTRFEEYDSLQ